MRTDQRLLVNRLNSLCPVMPYGGGSAPLVLAALAGVVHYPWLPVGSAPQPHQRGRLLSGPACAFTNRDYVGWLLAHKEHSRLMTSGGQP